MDERGDTLVLVLILTSAITTTLIISAPMFQSSLKQSLTLNDHISASSLSSSLQAVLANANAWNATLADSAGCNPSLACLHNGTDCASGVPSLSAPRPINCLYDADGSLLFDGRNELNGFTGAGASCSGFGLNGGNASCTFRPSITWTMNCTAAPCVAPPITVAVNFAYASTTGLPFNPSAYNLTENH